MSDTERRHLVERIRTLPQEIKEAAWDAASSEALDRRLDVFALDIGNTILQLAQITGADGGPELSAVRKLIQCERESPYFAKMRSQGEKHPHIRKAYLQAANNLITLDFRSIDTIAENWRSEEQRAEHKTAAQQQAENHQAEQRTLDQFFERLLCISLSYKVVWHFLKTRPQLFSADAQDLFIGRLGGHPDEKGVLRDADERLRIPASEGEKLGRLRGRARVYAKVCQLLLPIFKVTRSKTQVGKKASPKEVGERIISKDLKKIEAERGKWMAGDKKAIKKGKEKWGRSVYAKLVGCAVSSTYGHERYQVEVAGYLYPTQHKREKIRADEGVDIRELAERVKRTINGEDE